jgi:polysaccharide export outer membrane protein
MQATNPNENIPILPHDVISVPVAELVYVIGEVRKSGGFILKEQETLSVLQALSLAEGLAPTAAANRAKILRPSGHSQARTEIAVDVKRLLSGQTEDIPLQANDILFIPNSAAKKALVRSLETGLQIVTGVAVYRR